MNRLACLAATLLLVAFAARAQVTVDKPWVRSTVAQQTTTGAFMTVTSARDAKLVEASSPVANSVEVHEMKMEGDLMRMRRVDSVPLPAGKAVEFKSGAYHVMLLGLKAPVKAGDVVPIKLVVEDAKGQREMVEVKAVARGN